MELVRGAPITDYCDKVKLSIDKRLELFVTVCRAIQHAHQKGIIHRDIKPTNILVTLHDGVPVPKVIDFGVAKAVGQQLTEHTLYTGFAQMVGTPLYMSPEQAELSGLDIDTRSDVYSLGVLLYELLTSHTPFDKETLRSAGFDEFRRKVREEEPPIPSSRVSTVKGDLLATIADQRGMEAHKLGKLMRGELDWIVMRALEKDRNRRYESASAFAADIDRYLADEPVLACPPSAAYKARKFLRRHKGPVAAALTVVLTLLVGIIGTTYGLIRANNAHGAELKQRHIAEQNEKQATAFAQAEQRARHESEARRGRLEKSNDLLGSLLFELDPEAEENAGRPLRALLGESLDEAAVALEREALGDPETMALLQSTLGRSFVGLGYYDKALPLLEKALQTRRDHLGADHPDTFVSMNDLGVGLTKSGKLDDAESLLEETVKKIKAALGADHRETLAAMGNLATAHLQSGKLDQAIALLEEAHQRRLATLGTDDADTIWSMNSLGEALVRAGKIEKARALLKQALDRAKVQFGPEASPTLQVIHNLAAAHMAAEDLEEALPLFEELLPLLRARFGGDHPRTLVTADNLAMAYQHSGRADLALALHEDTFALLKAKLGPNDSHTLIAANNLASACQSVGKLQRALQLYEETLPAMQAQRGEDDRETLSVAHNLATAYQEDRQFDRALRLYEETLALRRKKLGADDLETQATMNQLASAYWKAQKFHLSVPLFEELVPLQEKKRGREHPDTLMTMANLAVNYRDFGQLQDAAAMAQEFYERYATLPPQRRASTDWFVPLALQIFMQAGHPEHAEPILREKLTEVDKHYGRDSPQAASSRALLGLVLLQIEKYAEAERVLRESLSVRQKHQPDAWTTFYTEAHLGGALLGQKKYAQAEPLLLAGYEGMRQREQKIPPHGKPRLTETLQRLVELYQALEKPAEAEKRRKELAEWRQSQEAGDRSQESAGKTPESDVAPEACPLMKE